MRPLQTMNVIIAILMYILAIACVTVAITQAPPTVYPVVVVPDGVLYNVPSWGVIALLAVFCGITAGFHTHYAQNKAGYKAAAAEGRNPLRWIEYSMTASLMAVAIAMLAGTTVLGEQLTIGICTGMVMLLGLVIESSTQKRIQLLATGIGWVLMLTVWGVIWTNFGQVISAVPPFVIALTVISNALFLSFGVVQLAQVHRGYKGRHEYIYSILSLVAKSFLVIITLAGLANRP